MSFLARAPPRGRVPESWHRLTGYLHWSLGSSYSPGEDPPRPSTQSDSTLREVRMRKPWLLAVLLALALTSWNAAVAAPGPREGPDDSQTDGVIDSARESDPVHLDQHGGTGGHLPPTSHNVQLVGKLRVHDAARGIVADVGELGNFAYLAQFSPGCTADGAGGAYGLGGVSLWDITNPLAPVALAQNFGDTTDALGNTIPVRQYHSVFAWQQDGRAFVVASDDEEQAQTDVDIMEITD